jgi:trehalose/maltose hydrolase-like predicted phosphorylase
MPAATEGGLINNAYTNLMVVWTLRQTLGLLERLEPSARRRLSDKVGLTAKETARWRDVAGRMALPMTDDGLLEQFEGYSELEEVDWERYRARHGDIHRMDRILKAEGKSPDDFKVSKQADTLMLFYNLPAAEVRELVRSLGYEVGQDFARRHLEAHLRHTSHGSTLSRIVHAQLAAEVGDHELSWQMFRDALTSDYEDIQGGTTAEGIHTGVMASTVLVALRAYVGLELGQGSVRITPRLPPRWRRVSFGVRLQGTRYDMSVTPESGATGEK